MIRPTARARSVAVAALALGALNWTANPATAAPTTADLGPVTCGADQGAFGVTVAAERDLTFAIFVEDSFGQEATFVERNVAANQSTVIEIADLDDDDYRVTVTGYDPESEDENDDVSFGVVLIDAQALTVACDPAPVGPYSNPRAVVGTDCTDVIEIRASNKPIGGNTADLQPVTFTLTYTPFDELLDEPGDEPTIEPGDEPTDEVVERRAARDPVVLDTFTLDAASQTFGKTYEPEGGDYFYGDVAVTADGKTIASGEVSTCVLGPPPIAVAAEGGGAALPNTGA